jgi:hypothetical protein
VWAKELSKVSPLRRRRSVSVRSVLEAAAREVASPAIGTLNEGALHAQLKDWYRRPGDRVEVVVDDFVVDLVRGDLLVEIQTGSFAPLRRKLELLLPRHRVRLVAPVPLARRIIRLSDQGELLSARRSPRRGRLEDVFSRLVSIASLLCCQEFELEVLLTQQDELRVYRPGQAYRRHGWVVVGRRLVSVERRVRIACPDDAAGLLPPGLAERFDSAQLAEAAGIERRLAQQVTYCLRAMGVLQAAGKRGNTVIHRRTGRNREHLSCVSFLARTQPTATAMSSVAATRSPPPAT